jgi:hypothetical protein
MKVEGPHLDPIGWLEVRLLEVVGGSKVLSVYMVVKRRCEGTEFKIRWKGRERRAKEGRFIADAYPLHEFQISPQCIKLQSAPHTGY